MAQVTNTSAGGVDVPLYGLVFGPGETVEVADDVAASLSWPLEIAAAASAPAGPAEPAPAPETPAEPVGGNPQ